MSYGVKPGLTDLGIKTKSDLRRFSVLLEARSAENATICMDAHIRVFRWL